MLTMNWDYLEMAFVALLVISVFMNYEKLHDMYFAKQYKSVIMNIATIIIACLAGLGVLCIMYISLFGGEEGMGKILGVLLGCIVLFFVWLCSLVGISGSGSLVLLWIISLIACGIIFYQVGLKEGKRSQNGQ